MTDPQQPLAGSATAIPTCRVPHCDAFITDDGTLCLAHKRGMKLTIKLTDAVYEYLHHVKPTRENEEQMTEAGTHLADALALLLKGTFDPDIAYDRTPISLATVSSAAACNWNVVFRWIAHANRYQLDDFEDQFDDDDEDE